MHPPTSIKGEHTPSPNNTQESSNVRQQFVVFALNMSWQLAVAVLVPVLAGVELDKLVGSTDTFVFIGLAIAAIGSALVLWRTMQAANRLPVPKLTAEQKRAIQKSYEEEDEDTTWSTMWTDLVGKYAFDFGFDRVTQDSVNRVPKFKEARWVRDARQLTLLTLEHFLVRVEDYRQLGKTALDAAK